MRKSTFFLTVILALAAVSAPGQIVAKVISVYDGDTITVLDADKRQHKIRLAGIDAPEVRQDFGQRAKRYLSGLVFGKAVTIDGEKIDRHGRRVAKVIVNGRDANLEMVMSGLAWWYWEYQREQSPRDREPYAAAEAHARKERLGLWSMPNPQAPWEFRHPKTPAANAPTAPIIGNRNSRIYHWPECEGYNKVAERNRVPFKSKSDAEAAGFRAAKNCRYNATKNRGTL